jgi:uncharacterized protein YbaR (Trm112 family)
VHILLTDLLCCPRCGPDFGLIVQADHREDRQVIEGRLGCANCRQTYPIDKGVADLRLAGAESFEDGDPSEASEVADRSYQAAALMGAQTGPSTVLVMDETGAGAGGISSTLPETHVVAASRRPLPVHIPAPEGSATFLSRVLVGSIFPFRNRVFRGAALLDSRPTEQVAGVGRTLIPGARLVIDRASEGTAEQLRQAGYQVLLDQDGVVVAVTPGGR